MSATSSMLLAIDDSEASRRAVSYVARIVGCAPCFRIRLFHVLPPIPAALLEHGGHHRPADQERVERELDEETARWRKRSEEAASGLVDSVRETLTCAGVPEDDIAVSFAAPLPEETIGFHLTRAADEHGCDTVVVGRAPRSWLGEAFHSHPSQALLSRKACGTAVWIVNECGG